MAASISTTTRRDPSSTQLLTSLEQREQHQHCCCSHQDAKAGTHIPASLSKAMADAVHTVLQHQLDNRQWITCPAGWDLTATPTARCSVLPAASRPDKTWTSLLLAQHTLHITRPCTTIQTWDLSAP